MGYNHRELTSGLENLAESYDLVVIGAGLSGAVVANQASKKLGYRSLVLDKRDHIGGNCYDFINKDGILVNKYGAHIFHTKSQRVWDYVHEYSEWVPYEHSVKGWVKDINNERKIVPIPPNQETINTLFGTNIHTEEEMAAWLNLRKLDLNGREAKNAEEMSLSRVGLELYEKIFKHYTKKQWDKYPHELDACILSRIPVRLNNNPRYFSDPYEALPKYGYTKMFENMLLDDPNIDVRVNVDYFQNKNFIPSHKKLIFTGPIDAFYANQGMEKLEYRSLDFEVEYWQPESGFYQPAFVVNNPNAEENWTRIVEYKHTPNQPKSVLESTATVIYKKFSKNGGDPYYPVPNARNHDLYAKYQELAAKEEGVVFVGRLASYKYFNMEEAVRTALELSDRLFTDNED